MKTYNNEIALIFQILGFSVSSLDEANSIAQSNFLRRGERWNSQPKTELYQKINRNKELILKQLTALKMIEEQLPQNKHYTYALIMGSLKEDVAHIFAFLKTLIDRGYSFDHYILLGSHRALLPEEKEDLPSEITTEAGMMEFLWKTHFTQKDRVIINAPLIQTADGSYKRPTTDDTLKEFASQFFDKKGSCLVVSENPYLARQIKTAQRILRPHGFEVDGAGSQTTPENSDIVMLMDEFARLLYEMNCNHSF